ATTSGTTISMGNLARQDEPRWRGRSIVGRSTSGLAAGEFPDGRRCASATLHWRSMSADALDAARRLLPWWVAWLDVLISAPSAAALSALVTWITAAIAARPLRRPGSDPESLPWHERARLEHPLRRALWRVRVVAAVVVALLAAVVSGPFSRVHGGVLALL